MIFGNQNYSFSTWVTQDKILGSKYTFSKNGRPNSLSIFIMATVTTTNVKCAIYDSSFNFIGETEVKNIVEGVSLSWEAFKISGVDLSAGDYWLAVISEENDLELGTIVNAGSSNLRTSLETYPTFPDPWSPTNDYSYDLSIYCEVKQTKQAKPTTSFTKQDKP